MNTIQQLRKPEAIYDVPSHIYQSVETPEMEALHHKVNRSAAAALFIGAATATAALTFAALPVVLVGAGALLTVAAAGYAFKSSRTVKQMKTLRDEIFNARENILKKLGPQEAISIKTLNQARNEHAISDVEYTTVIQETLDETLIQNPNISYKYTTDKGWERIAIEELKYSVWLHNVKKDTGLVAFKLNQGIKEGYLTEDQYKACFDEMLQDKGFDYVLRNFWNYDNAKPWLKTAWVKDLLSDKSLKGALSLKNLMSVNDKYKLGFSQVELEGIRTELAAFVLGRFKEIGFIPGFGEPIGSDKCRKYRNYVISEEDQKQFYNELLKYIPQDDPEMLAFVSGQLIERLKNFYSAPSSDVAGCWSKFEKFLKENTNLSESNRDRILCEMFKIIAHNRIQNYLEGKEIIGYGSFREGFFNIGGVPLQFYNDSEDDPYSYQTYPYRDDSGDYYFKALDIPFNWIVSLVEPNQRETVKQKFLLGIAAEEYVGEKRKDLQRKNKYQKEKAILVKDLPNFLAQHGHLKFNEFMFEWLITDFKDDFIASVEKYGNGADYRAKAVHWYATRNRSGVKPDFKLLLQLLKAGVLTLNTCLDVKDPKYTFANEIASRIEEAYYEILKDQSFGELLGDCFYEQILTKDLNEKGKPIQKIGFSQLEGPAHAMLAASEFEHLFSSERERKKNESGGYESYVLPDLNRQDRLPGDQYYVRAESFASDNYKQALKKAREDFATLSQDPNWFHDDTKWKRAVQIYDELDKANDFKQ